jgi:hypothetical protein
VSRTTRGSRHRAAFGSSHCIALHSIA